jgi:uncharacterized protein YkwD
MSKHLWVLVTLIAFCLLASCRAEIVEIPGTPTASLVASASPTHAHTPTASATPSPGPTTGTEDLSSTVYPSVSATHTVQPGDTLLGLARQYGVPMAAIQLQNKMGDSTVVQVGETLSIPSQADWEGAALLPFNLEGASSFWVVHVVKPGETLVGIAHTFGLKAADLQAVNRLTDADYIVIGQELVLPLDAPAEALAPTADATASATPSPTPTASATPSLSPTVSVTSTLPTTSPTAGATAVPAASLPPDIAVWPHETVRIINEVRAAHGLGPLSYNETLAQAAQAHANDCAQRGWCSHTGSDGADIKTRILRVGYDPASWAECWAQRQTPQGAVDIWMDETPPNDPHRRTLLTTWLTEIGMGVAQTTWGYYFIADFGRR